MTDLRRRPFGPRPTAQDWRDAPKASIEQALAAEVARRSPKLYAGYDEDAVKFVRNTMGTTKWDLLLAAESFGLAPQGTYLAPDERRRYQAGRPSAQVKIQAHATKLINPEYLRKTTIAAQLADDAWLRGGLDEMDAELKGLRRNEADPVIIGEFERLYHKQMRQVLPEQRLRQAPKSINPEYLRKTTIAAQLADDAWLRGGLDEMDAELKGLRRNEADPVIIGEFERLYHKQMRQVLPEQRLRR